MKCKTSCIDRFQRKKCNSAYGGKRQSISLLNTCTVTFAKCFWQILNNKHITRHSIIKDSKKFPAKYSIKI